MPQPSVVRRIALVRHASTAWNVSGKLNSHTDLSLSEIGRTEATLLARRLRDEMPAAEVWASPSVRAQQTAAEICARLGGEPRISQDAQEAGFGRFEGLTRDELTTGDEGDFYAHWERGLPVDGAEPLASVGARAQRVYASLLVASETADQILVSHGVFIRVLLCVAVLGLEPTAYRRLVTDNASVSVVCVDPEVHRLCLLNSVHHLRSSSHQDD